MTTTTMKDFTILQKIGTGAFSEVYKVLRKSDKAEYALKKVRLAKLSEKEKANSINEVRILASINHENIAGYKEAFFEESTSTLCIVMEFANGGDLQSKINQLKKSSRHMQESDVWSIFYQMVNGLHALHQKKIVHRDIKCANVFLTKSGIVKLGDLNVSKIAKQGIMQTQTGTPYYASPEVWQDKPYDKSSDIWSLGAVLYEMIALNPPFTAKDMKGLYQRVIKGVYPKIPSTYSNDLSAMVASLLKVDPKKRPSTEQILHMPVFIAKYNESLSNLGGFGNENPDLIGTIKVPRNLSLLGDRLPASQYESDAKVQSKPIDLKGLQVIQEDENDYKPRVGPKKVEAQKEPFEDLVQMSKQLGIIDGKNKDGNINSEDYNTSNAQPRSRLGSGQKSRLQENHPRNPAYVRNQSGLERVNNRNSSRVNSGANSRQQSAQQVKPVVRRNPSPMGRNARQMSGVRGAHQVNQHQSVNPDYISSRDPALEIQQNEIIRVQPHHKMQIHGLPGSSPLIRNGAEDLKYQQRYGKGPLIERAERLRRLQEIQSNLGQKYHERKVSQQNLSGREDEPTLQDNAHVQMVKDNRPKPLRGHVKESRRSPGSHMDVIHRAEGSEILFQEDNSLPQIRGSQLEMQRGRNNLNVAGSHIVTHGQEGHGYNQNFTPQMPPRYVKPPLHQIYGVKQRDLQPSRSKDYLHSNQSNLRSNRYAGAGSIVEAGRMESQRLLMERYKRIEESNTPISGVGSRAGYKPKFVQPAQGMYHQYYSNFGGGSAPPVDQSRQYIPMSQKGSRPVHYSKGGESRQINPAMAMKLMYNQPSQAQLPQPGQQSRPSWWG